LKADTFKSTHDEVLRRVGRNLLLFQQIEGLLKGLLANHKGGGSLLDFKARQEEQEKRINKQMIGQLVEKYGTEVLQDDSVEVTEEKEPVGMASFAIRIQCDAEFLESVRRDLKLMTEERNELVHAFLPRWQPDSPEKMTETLSYLDEQREKVLPILEHLKATIADMKQSRALMAEFIAGDEFRQQIELLWLQTSPLVSFLRKVTNHIHRQDGWTDLAQADKRAREELPDEIKALKEKYGFKTLKKLLNGCGVFDVLDEPTDNGKFRTLYRARTRY